MDKAWTPEKRTDGFQNTHINFVTLIGVTYGTKKISGAFIYLFF